MNLALKVSHLTKRFEHFSLEDISFELPQGCILGIIGENGSGKSTLIRCILGQDIPDAGSVEIFGISPSEDISVHNLVGAAFAGSSFPPFINAKQLGGILSEIYRDWDQERYEKLLDLCELPQKQRITDFSKGMKAKLEIAAALSHHAGLLILDEATSGLDSVIRESILDLLLEFLQDETHSVLMTSHITSDLEKAADYILFLRDGKAEFVEDKDVLQNEYAIAKVRSDQLEFIDPSLICRRRSLRAGCELLIRGRAEFAQRYPDYLIENANLDDLVLFFEKGDCIL